MRLIPSTLAVCGSLTCAWACGSAFTSGDSGTSGATSAQSSGSGSGGSGMTGGSAVSTGVTATSTGVTATSTGTGSGGCGSCGIGDYCNQSQMKCVKCTDVSTFQFGPANKLTALNGNGSNQRFPRRTTAIGHELVFRNGPAGATALQFSADYQLLAGGPMSGTTQPDQIQSGPLDVNVKVGNVTANFFWDSGPVSGNRVLYMGVHSGATVVGATPLPSPYNGVGSSYSIAIANGSGRVLWMSKTDVSSQAALMTTVVNGSAMTPPAPIKIALGNGCARQGDDATPWVTQDGQLLLFRALELGGQCQPNGAANDLYAVSLGKDGTPGTAAPLSVNHAGWDDTDPALSADLCTLYFASDEGMGEYDVFAAQRQ